MLALVIKDVLVGSQTTAFDLNLIMYICVHGLLISALIIMMIRYGSEYNALRKSDSLILIRKQMDLETQLSHTQRLIQRYPQLFYTSPEELAAEAQTPEDLAKLTRVKIQDPSYKILHALEALRTIQMAVSVDNVIHSIKILGFEAGHELVKSMFALVLTGLFLSLREVLQ